MGFGKNRKGSGVILTGAFAVPAAISFAQQGIVSAGLGYTLNGRRCLFSERYYENCLERSIL